MIKGIKRETKREEAINKGYKRGRDVMVDGEEIRDKINTLIMEVDLSACS